MEDLLELDVTIEEFYLMYDNFVELEFIVNQEPLSPKMYEWHRLYVCKVELRSDILCFARRISR